MPSAGTERVRSVAQGLEGPVAVVEEVGGADSRRASATSTRSSSASTPTTRTALPAASARLVDLEFELLATEDRHRLGDRPHHGRSLLGAVEVVDPGLAAKHLHPVVAGWRTARPALLPRRTASTTARTCFPLREWVSVTTMILWRWSGVRKHRLSVDCRGERSGVCPPPSLPHPRHLHLPGEPLAGGDADRGQDRDGAIRRAVGDPRRPRLGGRLVGGTAPGG